MTVLRWPALCAKEIILSRAGKWQVWLAHKCVHICSSFKRKEQRLWTLCVDSRCGFWIVHVWQWWEVGRWNGSALYICRVLGRANSPHLEGLSWWLGSREIYTSLPLPPPCLSSSQWRLRFHVKGKVRPHFQPWAAWAKQSPGSVPNALQRSARALQWTRRKKETWYLPGLCTAWHDWDLVTPW